MRFLSQAFSDVDFEDVVMQDGHNMSDVGLWYVSADC